MSLRIGLISNPGSGHNREQFGALEARIRDSDILHVVTHSAAEIPEALTTLREADVSLLAINGGDGTVAAILGAMLEQALFEPPPPVAILPGGTANMTAGDIGMRGSLKQAVQRLCEHADRGTAIDHAPVPRSLLRVAGRNGELHHGMFLGAGAIIQGTEYAHEEIHARGLRDDFSLALTTVRTVWGVVRGDPRFARHQRIRIGLDGAEHRDHDTLILALSTLKRLAFGMRPFYGREPGALRLTLMEQGCSRFGRTFTGIVRGKPGANAVPEQGYFSHNADSIALDMQGKVNLDGEIIEVDGELAITATRPLEFLQL